MTLIQRLQLRASEIRSRLNELAGLTELTDELRAETDRLTAEYADVERRSRAATIGGDEPEPEPEPATAEPTGEGAEVRQLIERAEVRRFLQAAVSGAGVDGAEAELQAALDVPATREGGAVIPWEALEARQDVVTQTTANDGPSPQRPILQRLFGRSVSAALGVRFDSVPAGRPEYTLFNTGVSPAMTDEGSAKNAEGATFTQITLKPKRLTGRYRWTVEMGASVGGIEAAFRRDLRDAVQNQINSLIVNGRTASPQIAGVLSRLSAPTSPSSVATFADLSGSLSGVIDGIHAMMESEVSVLLGVETYRLACKTFQSGSGESATEAMSRRGRSLMACSYIPDPASNIQAALLHGGASADRGDSVAAMWPGVEVIRDPYTAAAEGEVSLTWVVLLDMRTAFREAAYKRLAFKVA